MTRVEKLSSTADAFPATEVEYEDILGMPYASDGRFESGSVDCLGVVLEVYRRAGLGLPDPAVYGGSIEALNDIFEEVAAADTLYDLVDLRYRQHHLMVVIRPGVLLSAKERVGVYAPRLKPMAARADVRFWRLKSAALPA